MDAQRLSLSYEIERLKDQKSSIQDQVTRLNTALDNLSRSVPDSGAFTNSSDPAVLVNMLLSATEGVRAEQAEYANKIARLTAELDQIANPEDRKIALAQLQKYKEERAAIDAGIQERFKVIQAGLDEMHQQAMTAIRNIKN